MSRICISGHWITRLTVYCCKTHGFQKIIRPFIICTGYSCTTERRNGPCPVLTEMIRLIASDIDGTLVPDGAPALNPEYFEVIPALQKKGIIFCPCSGRSYQSMHTLFAPIADSLYFISENGTILRTEEKVLYTWPVPAEYVRPLVEEGRKLPGISVMICTPDKTYCECGEDGELYRTMHDDYHYNIENIPDVLDVPADQVLKVSYFHSGDRIEEVCAPVTESDWAKKVQLLCAGTKWLECVALNAGKGEAFALLQELLDIPQEETVYFGDNMNDLSAFTEAGVSATVSSARSEVRDAADLVGHSVRHEGVLRELKRILAVAPDHI